MIKRLSDEKIQQFKCTSVEGQENILIDHWDIKGLLDAQIAECQKEIDIDKVSTLKGLEKEIGLYLCQFPNNDMPCVECFQKAIYIIDKVKLHILQAKEAARKEERERIVGYLQDLLELSAKVKEPAITVKLTNILQALKDK
jgi:hypothetical protein